MSRPHVVVMVTTSYPRFPGDGVGSFMEPIAKGLAARGHEIHVVAPWHPLITRPRIEDGVHFHFFRYAPVAAWHVFGYASGLRADTNVKLGAWLITPPAIASGWRTAARVAARHRATVMHGNWVIPGGAMAAIAAPRVPLVVSVHGSDVFVAERHAVIGRVARRVFARAGWVTACSDDLRARATALGADAARISTVPYGVDTTRFAPDPGARAAVRRALDLEHDTPLVAAAGRLVGKKGFEYLIDAATAIRARAPRTVIAIAGAGDLAGELARRAASINGGAVRLLGNAPQSEVARLFAGADVVAIPSVRDAAGNVDGLPNTALEALATGTPVVATDVGGLPLAVEDGRTGRLVPPADAAALAGAVADLLTSPDRGAAIGAAGRGRALEVFGWPRAITGFEQAFDSAVTMAPDRRR